MAPRGRVTALGALLLLITGRAQAAAVVYVDEQAFLDAVAALPATGLVTVHEGFEDEPPWDGVRTTMIDGVHGAADVARAGLTWSSNHPDAVREPSLVTTSPGAARSGGWGLYATPHGNPDAIQPTAWLEDGFALASAGTLYAAGGWFTATAGASLVAIVDGAAASPASLGPVDNTFTFYGVIDSAGFHAIEFRETEGTREDQKFVWADDFSVVGSLVPDPPAADAGPAPGPDASAAGDATVPADATLSTDVALTTDSALATDAAPPTPDASTAGASDAGTDAGAQPDTAARDGGAPGDTVVAEAAAGQDAAGFDVEAIDRTVPAAQPDAADAAPGDDAMGPLDLGGSDAAVEVDVDTGQRGDGARAAADRPGEDRVADDGAAGCACDSATTPRLSSALGLALWILMWRRRRQPAPARSRRPRHRRD